MEDTGAVGSLQCLACKGGGIAVRQCAVLELGSGRGGTGLVHVTCPHCAGDGRRPGFVPPV